MFKYFLQTHCVFFVFLCFVLLMMSLHQVYSLVMTTWPVRQMASVMAISAAVSL